MIVVANFLVFRVSVALNSGYIDAEYYVGALSTNLTYDTSDCGCVAWNIFCFNCNEGCNEEWWMNHYGKYKSILP